MFHSLIEIEQLKLVKQAEKKNKAQAQVLTQMPQAQAAEA